MHEAGGLRPHAALQGRIKLGANPPVPDIAQARLQQQEQRTGSTEQGELDRSTTESEIASRFQQQLISDGWDYQGEAAVSGIGPLSPATHSDSEASVDGT